MPSRSVKDCRVGRKKCALLAMTNLIGFAGIRNGFQNETLEKQCGASPRKKWPHKRKTPVFQIKPSQFRVIARPQSGRGNLKAEGMAFLGEAQERKTTESPNFGSSRSDTTTLLLRKRHFTRAEVRISRAQHISHDQRSYFTAQPCRASFRDAGSFRQRLPRQALKMSSSQ